jgi:hypothetical protein
MRMSICHPGRDQDAEPWLAINFSEGDGELYFFKISKFKCEDPKFFGFKVKPFEDKTTLSSDIFIDHKGRAFVSVENRICYFNLQEAFDQRQSFSSTLNSND